jgi:hypothetical protein
MIAFAACSIAAWSAAPRTRCRLSVIAPSARCRLSVGCAFGALGAPRDWAARVCLKPLAGISGAHSHRAPSPPRFSEGEKVAEGRMRGLVIDASTVHVGRLTWVSRNTGDSSSHRTQSPLIRLRHLLPPQKARGEKVAEARAALVRTRGVDFDNAPKAQSTDNRQRAAGGRQAAGGAT